MAKHIFTSLINCDSCGKKYNFKNNNGTYEYICQTRKNKGKNACNAQILKEDFLLDIVKKHCNLLEKKFSESKVKLFVKEIKVGVNNLKILYRDGTVSKIDENNIIF